MWCLVWPQDRYWHAKNGFWWAHRRVWKNTLAKLVCSSPFCLPPCAQFSSMAAKLNLLVSMVGHHTTNRLEASTTGRSVEVHLAALPTRCDWMWHYLGRLQLGENIACKLFKDINVLQQMYLPWIYPWLPQSIPSHQVYSAATFAWCPRFHLTGCIQTPCQLQVHDWLHSGLWLIRGSLLTNHLH